MKTIMKIAIILSIFFMIASVNAIDIYNINDVKNLGTSIHMQEKPINAYIDYRDVNEAPSGGYIEESKELILPHDLGLGQHNICFIIEDENGNYISKTSYQFNILKDENDNPAIYKGYTPYYYEEIEDDMIEEDYKTFQELYDNSTIQPLFVSTQPQITLQNVIKQNEQESLPLIHVNLGIINKANNSLTSQEITLDL